MAGIIDSIVSTFNKNKSKKPKTDRDRHALLLSRLSVAKSYAKKPHRQWKKYLREYEIEDVSDMDEIRDKVRIGYLFRKSESDMPAIFETQPELFFKTRNQAYKQLQKPIENVYDYLWDIQDMEEQIENAALYFTVIGLGMVKSPYVTKTKTVTEMQMQPVVNEETGEPVTNLETGEIQMEEVEVEYEVPIFDSPKSYVPNPFKIYFSPETKFAPVLDSENCPYFFEELTMTVEEIKAKFGYEVDATETMKIDKDELSDDEDPDISNRDNVQEDDLKRVTVYEYYGVLPEDMAPKGSDWSFDKCYHMFITKSEELYVSELEYRVKPLLLLGNYGMAHRFWKFGDAKHLLPLIQEVEMYRSQILLHTRKMANPKPLVHETAQVDENAFTDPRVGKTVKWAGQIPPSYLSPASLGGEVSTGLNEARTDLEKTSGSFDLASGSNQSTVKTPRGITVFAEAAEKNIRRKRKKVARFIRHLIIFQFSQVADNWDIGDPRIQEIILGGDEELTEMLPMVMEFLSDDNLQTKMDIEVESLATNRVQQKQDALDLWDQVAQRPDIFNLDEAAKDLLQNGYSKKDADRYLIPAEQRAAIQQQQQLQNASIQPQQ